MTRILVADDHPVVRQGLRHILAEEFAPAEVGEAKNGDEVMEQVQRRAWDIIVLDLSMPGKNGLDLIKDLKQQHPAVRLLVLTMLSEEQLAIRVLRAGAEGFLTKDEAPEELVLAIKKILGGGKYVNPTLAQALTFDLVTRESEKPLHAQLSDREYQVLCFIATGKSVKDIAGTLSLSIKTINTYRSRILEKLNLKSNVELTRYVIEHRLNN
ncbi:MAG TPA: response regulator transcription factor [Bacteroidota bacterium]